MQVLVHTTRPEKAKPRLNLAKTPCSRLALRVLVVVQVSRNEALAFLILSGSPHPLGGSTSASASNSSSAGTGSNRCCQRGAVSIFCDVLSISCASTGKH